MTTQTETTKEKQIPAFYIFDTVESGRQEGKQARRRRLRPQEGHRLQLPHQRQTLRGISAEAEDRSSNRSTRATEGKGA